MLNKTETASEYSERLLKLLREAEEGYMAAEVERNFALKHFYSEQLKDIRYKFEKSLKYVLYE